MEGKDAEVLSVEDERIEFRVPDLRACETDLRRVEVDVGGADVLEGRVPIQNTIEMDVGESRILSREDLACLQLGGADRAYLLTLSSLTTDRISETPLLLHGLSARASGEGVAAAAAWAGATASPVGAAILGHSHDHSYSYAADHEAAGGGNFEAFDDYSGAEVGDTVRFVDWTNPAAYSAETKDDVPTYDAVVLAKTATQFVAVDLRSSEAEQILASDQIRDRIQAAADMVDPVMVPAMQGAARRRIPNRY